MKEPMRVAITGAAGNIGYALLFRIAAGELLGPDQPVILHLLEIPQAIDALNGVVMELHDCAFPLLDDIVATADLNEGFQDANYALLVGARPRGAGMERKDLLSANGAIFTAQGKALNDHAARDVRVVVVGNPANTNALIAAANAPDLAPSQFSAMMRLDHARTVSQLAQKTGAKVQNVKRVTVWGNHSATQFPDISQCLIEGQSASSLVDQDWYRDTMIPAVQQRGAAIIKARGSSSAASAASAAIGQMHSWVAGTPDDDWVSMAVPSDGSYGIKEGIFYSFPCTCKNGAYSIVQGLEIDDFARQKMQLTEQELREERAAVEDLLHSGG